MKMNKIILKNKIMSLVGAFVLLFAGLASVFSFAGTKKGFTNSTKNSANAAYLEENYKTYADDLIEEINQNNTNSFNYDYSLKNDYPILAENQTDSKLCWAYSGLKVLETTLMIERGEYYNFSEMAVAYFAYLNKSSSTIDSFGSFKKLDETIRSMGIVNESDFSNDNYGRINETNHNDFSTILKFADTNLPSTIAPIYLSRNANFKASNNEENVIKYYIKNIGGLNIALPKGSMFRQDQSTAQWVFEYNVTSSYEGKNLDENHAVCLIGWNDTGFIGLNSWGVNVSQSYEEVVIPYSVMNKYYRGEILFEGSKNEDWLCGYNYIGGENVEIETTSADKFSIEVLKKSNDYLKNVFYLTESINMSFKIKNVTNFETVYLNIFKAGEDVTSYFTVSYDDVNSIINISFTPKNSQFISQSGLFAGGSYSLYFYEDVKLISLKNITIYTGSEISYIEFKNSSINSKDPVYYSAMNTIATADGSETQYIYYANSYTINIYLTDLGRLSRMTGELPASYLAIVNGMMVYDEDKGEFIAETNSNYLTCEGNVSSTGNCYSFKLRNLTESFAGKLVKFFVNIRSPYYPDNCSKTFEFMFFVSGTEGVTASSNAYKINYFLDGGKNNVQNVDIYPQYTKDSMTDFVLEIPAKSNYIFEGWYLDSSFTTEIEKIDANLTGNISLFAKWRYSDTVYYSTNLEVDKIYEYDKSEKNLSGLNLQDSANLIYGQSIMFKSTFLIEDELKAESFTFKYYFNINGERVKEVNLIGSSDMGSVKSVYYGELGGLNDENLAFPNLEVGTYNIELVASAVVRHKFSINKLQTFTITVSPKEVNVVYDANGSMFTYDANAHKPVASFAGYYAEDSSDFAKLNFVEEGRIDAGEYSYSIQDITNKNYVLNSQDKNHKYLLHIGKKPLELNWIVKEVFYNGKPQEPKCEILGLVGEDRVYINFERTGYVDAGEYQFVVKTITNSNYSVVANQLVNFKIKQAPITVRFNDVEERARSSPAYREKITYKVEGNFYDTIDSLGISCYSEGLTATESGEYVITGNYNKEHSNYDINFIPGNYVLTGYYYVYYTLPNGEVVKELVNYGEKPVGVTEEMLKLKKFQKLILSTGLEETGDDIYVVVTVEDYSWYVIIGGIVIGFIVFYWFVTRKSRRNKVR